MLRKLPCIAILILCCGWIHGSAVILSPGWHTLNVGGGGFQTRIAFSNSGNVKLDRNDGGNAYRWDATANQWALMNSKANTPNADTAPYIINNTPMVYEFAPAPNDDTRVYMTSISTLLKSTDGGKIFSDLPNFPRMDGLVMGVGANSHYRLSQPKGLAVDVTSSDKVYWCSPAQGFFRTTDGGTSWTQNTTVPANLPGQLFATFATNGSTAVGLTVLNFTSITAPATGTFVYDATHPTAIQPGTVVVASSTTTITLSLPVINTDVLLGDSILVTNGNGFNKQTLVTNGTTNSSQNTLHFSAMLDNGLAFVGMAIYDLTHPDAIPPYTTLANYNTSTFDVTMSQNAAGSGVQIGDTIAFTIGQPDAWPGCGAIVAPNGDLYIWPNGSGILKSTDGGVTFASAGAGGPASYLVQMTFGPDGTLWVVDGSSPSGENSNVWKYASSTFTRLTTTQVANSQAVGVIAVDPADANHIITTEMNETYDGFATPANGIINGFARSPVGGAARYAAVGDAVWQELTSEAIMAEAGYAFDPSNGRVYLAEGIGVWWGTPPGCKCAFHWNAQSRGIEDLQAIQISASPSLNGTVLVTAEDRALLRTSALISEQGLFPTDQYTSRTVGLNNGSGVNWAISDPNTVCAIASGSGVSSGLFLENSGCSSDGGVTWNRWWASYPTYNSPSTPLMTVAVDAIAGATTLTVSNVPAVVRTGMSVSNNSYFILTATGATLTTDNPAVLHFGAGNLSADLNIKSLGSFIYSGITFPNQISAHSGIAFWSQNGNTFSCINYTGSDCAGTSAGDITMASVLGDVQNVSIGTKLWFQATSAMPASSTITNIAGNVITLSSPLRQNVSAGAVIAVTANIAAGGDVAMTTPNNIIVLGASNQQIYPWYTKDAGKTWKNVIIANATTCTGGGACVGFNADGSTILESGQSGWLGGELSGVKGIAADMVQAHTFYLLNCRTKAGGGGIYTSIDDGDTWVRVYDYTIAIAGGCAPNSKMQAVAGNAGVLYVSGGTSGNRGLYKVTGANCQTLNCATVTLVPGTGPPFANFALTAPAPGHTFPALFISGPISGVNSIYRAVDADQASPTFVDVNGASKYINNSMRGVGCFEGDPNVYGRVYACHDPIGWVWGDFQNYLLNRDLDPAANDNSPAFMNLVG